MKPEPPTPARALVRELDRVYPQDPMQHSWLIVACGMIELRAIAAATVELEGFWVSPNRRRRGHALTMMARLKDLADRHGVAIRLRVERYPGDGPSNALLRAWYITHGFVPIPNTDRLRREPRK